MVTQIEKHTLIDSNLNWSYSSTIQILKDYYS